MKEVKDVAKLAQKTACATFYITAFWLALVPLTFCERAGTLPDWILVSVFLGLFGVVAGMFILHTVIFPKTISRYPIYEYDASISKEYGTDAKMATLPRLKIAGLMFSCGLAFTVGMNMLWPLGSVAKEIPQTVFYSKDDQALLTGDFGHIAFKKVKTPDNEECLWCCKSIDAYGPFKFAGELKELTVSRSIIDMAVEIESERTVLDSTEEIFLCIAFNHYEDGDWMIVKRFQSGENLIPLNGQSEWEILVDMIVSEKIPYEIHGIEESIGLIGTLTAATDGILTWESSGGEVAYFVTE